MTAWTAPRTWTSETMTSALLNTHLRDDLLHLYEKVPTGISPADRAGIGGAGTSEEWSTITTGLTWAPSAPTTVDSHTTIADHLYISNQADTTVRLGTKNWTPTGAAAYDARLGGVVIASDTSVAAVTGTFGLHIGDSGNNNRTLIMVRYTFDASAQTIEAYTYASATYTQRGATVNTSAGERIYLRSTRDASNNVSFYWSLNGMLWNFIATQALTYTVANIGIFASGNATAGFQAACDWMRTSV